MINYISASSSSDDLDMSQQNAKRSVRYQSQRSKAFQTSLENTKKSSRIFRLKQVIDLGEEKIYSVTRPAYGCENEVVERHSIKKCWNRALCDKSVKFGTHVQNPIRNKSGYRVTFDLTVGDL